MVAGDWNLYVIDAEGGVPRRLTPEPSDENVGELVPDGQWIYFSSDRSGSRRSGRSRPREAEPSRSRVTADYLAEESWDGEYLYYSKTDFSGVWRMPLAGGEETAIVNGPLSYWGWALSRSGIYYAAEPSAGGRRRAYAIRYLDFESGQVSEVFQQESPSPHMLLAVSPDERWILHLERPPPQSELMLVENFR